MNWFFQLALALWGFFLMRAYRAISTLRSLDDFKTKTSSKSLSIIIAVKDDENEIEETLAQVLKSKIVDLELIVVNDRSTDGTGKILERLSLQDKRLKVVTIDKLPNGWLGKVNALHQASKIATKDFMLFFDADMGTTDSVILNALGVMDEERLDHLAILPNISQKSFLLDLLMATSNVLFTMSSRPWLEIDYRPIQSVKGVGKFNLVRRSSFIKTSGFEWLKMEVADDVALAQLMAQNDGRSLFIRAGQNGPHLNWYSTFRDMVLGLEKNSVGGFTNYKWSIFLFMVTVSVMPLLIFLISLIFGQFKVGVLFIAFTLIFAYFAKSHIKYPLKLIAFLPLGIFILACVLVRSFLICQKNDGIRWSGTHYPLKQLRKGCRVRLGL